MRQVDRKMGMTIILFAMVMSGVCILIFFWFSSRTNQAFAAVDSEYGRVVVLTQEQAAHVMIGQADGDELLNKHMLSPEEFSKYYTEEVFQLIPAMLVIFLVVFIAALFLLWRVLLHMRRKKDVSLIQGLQAIMEDKDFQRVDPAFMEVYTNLKQKFSGYLEDYKRLHAYLSHEQKNRLAILRAEMEAAGIRRLLPRVDQIADGIDDVLTLSETAEQGELEEVDVALLCAAQCDGYSILQDNMTFAFDEEEDYTVLAKERWVTCAIGNLLDNAVKYGEGKPVSVRLSKEKGSVILSVQDQGKGMTAEEQEQIFAYAHRLQRAKQDGYGIGLSLISHVCSLCGGFIYVESEPGHGSEFTLSLPA